MVGALVLFVALSSLPSQDGVIKIGIATSLSGALIPWGTDARDGAQLAVDLVNASGGIRGKKVELLVEDCASTPEGGKRGAEKLIANGVVGLLGSVSSGITQPMAQVSREHGIPHMAIGATKPGITQIGENVFRACYTDEFQAHVMATFAYKSLGLKKIAIVTDMKQPYSQMLSKEFREFFTKLGGEIVGEVFYESAQMVFTSQVVEILKMKPDGLFLSGYFSEVGSIVRQSVQLGLNDVKFLGSDGWESMELLSSGGDAIIGGFFCNSFNPDNDNAGSMSFIYAWKTKYNRDPGTSMAALGYDAANLMLDAIKRAGSTDSEAVIAALNETEGFRGATGSITFKGHGRDPAKSTVINMVAKNGFISFAEVSYEEVYGKGG